MRAKRAHLGYENAAQVAAILQSISSGCLALALRAREAHWNVKGETFGPLHDLFGDIYDFLNDSVDELAERVVQLGGVASSLNGGWEPRPLCGDSSTLIGGLLQYASGVMTDIKNAFGYLEGDKISEDILIELGRELEKKMWMLEANLQKFQKVVPPTKK